MTGCSLFWNLDKIHAEEAASAKVDIVPLVGNKIEQAREIIRRCEERDASLLEQAQVMEAAGDHQGCWFAMATRTENTRFLNRVRADLEALGKS